MKHLKPFQPEDFLILAVDDLRKNLQLLIEILDKFGYGTTFALTGTQALERVKIAKPDLILLDLMMPEMNGLEVCKILKSDEITQDIPIIFLTASNEDNHLLQAFESGAVDYVIKPFKSPELLARVKIHLELKRTKDELKKAYEEMKIIASTDELTGIANRRTIFNIGQQEFERSQRYNAHFSLLMIDIDYFKIINDTYGHDIGDEALKMVVNTTLQCLRKVDHLGRLETQQEPSEKLGHLGRLGGEEFVVILPETPLEGATLAAKRVCHAVSQQGLQIQDKTVKITVSIGVSTFSHNDIRIDDVLKRADLALYEAKEKGRNQVAIMHNQ
ncbi:diguanylate cyclase [Crocosphaera sp. UHCC 0190]|uniref:GGDEF domain-containing response regulator n=1 Tax=Crocosphaera sp. UHCC 0190 TaxID=3110246 RepID=UPI002B21FE48|nr:diguanylate cyclase [Crocosphaera sp. UHCC 0190]MEA5509070.1 diguanylate cyclase [Crocosphaera sp. UHCC 0190]